MKARWDLLLLPPMLASLALLAVSQLVFIEGSFHRDLGIGRLAEEFDLSNYVKVFSDSFYVETLLLSIYVSAIATILTVSLAFPVAYVIARMRSQWALVLLAVLVSVSMVTIVIKVLGLMIIFSPGGFLNQALLSWGLLQRPMKILGTLPGVITGLMYYSLGFAILLFFSVISTISRSLEEAAMVHGASRRRVFTRVIVPLALPAIVSGSLMVFNISMGGFASTALIGVGKIVTLPVIVQRTVILETSYGLGAALAAILLVSVLLINLLSVAFVARRAKGRPMTL